MKNLIVIMALTVLSIHALRAQEDIPFTQMIDGEIVGDIFFEAEEEISIYTLDGVDQGFYAAQYANKKNSTKRTLKAIKKFITNKFDKNLVDTYQSRGNIALSIILFIDEYGDLLDRGGSLKINGQDVDNDIYDAFIDEARQVLKNYPKLIPGKVKDQKVNIEAPVTVRLK